MIDRATSSSAVPTVSELFFTFARISISAFGGALAWSRLMLVEEKRWLTAEEFNDLLSLCQFLPGPNIVNLSAIYGSRVRGVPGAVAAFAGLLGLPVLIMLLAGTLYNRYGALPEIRGALAGLAAGAAGLLIATAVGMARPLVRQRLGPAHVVAALAFAAIGVLRWPLLPVAAVLVPVSIGLAWWVRR